MIITAHQRPGKLARAKGSEPQTDAACSPSGKANHNAFMVSQVDPVAAWGPCGSMRALSNGTAAFQGAALIWIKAH